MKRLVRGLFALCVVAFSMGASAQQYYTYKGAMRIVKFRILPGKTADFYKYLGNVNKVLTAEKTAGIIVDYGILHSVDYGGPEKYDVAIVVSYKDMATFDTLSEKSDPVIAQAYGTAENRAAITKLGEESSEMVSSELVRGIALK